MSKKNYFTVECTACGKIIKVNAYNMEIECECGHSFEVGEDGEIIE
jgi:DNA-directed RNA polymerase subunit RPC12/RpoP